MDPVDPRRVDRQLEREEYDPEQEEDIKFPEDEQNAQVGSPTMIDMGVKNVLVTSPSVKLGDTAKLNQQRIRLAEKEQGQAGKDAAQVAGELSIAVAQVAQQTAKYKLPDIQPTIEQLPGSGVEIHSKVDLNDHFTSFQHHLNASSPFHVLGKARGITTANMIEHLKYVRDNAIDEHAFAVIDLRVAGDGKAERAIKGALHFPLSEAPKIGQVSYVTLAGRGPNDLKASELWKYLFENNKVLHSALQKRVLVAHCMQSANRTPHFVEGYLKYSEGLRNPNQSVIVLEKGANNLLDELEKNDELSKGGKALIEDFKPLTPVDDPSFNDSAWYLWLCGGGAK